MAGDDYAWHPRYHIWTEDEGVQCALCPEFIVRGEQYFESTRGRVRRAHPVCTQNAKKKANGTVGKKTATIKRKK